jgi:hypothetical protein
MGWAGNVLGMLLVNSTWNITFQQLEMLSSYSTCHKYLVFYSVEYFAFDCQMCFWNLQPVQIQKLLPILRFKVQLNPNHPQSKFHLRLFELNELDFVLLLALIGTNPTSKHCENEKCQYCYRFVIVWAISCWWKLFNGWIQLFVVIYFF